jgi:hypothetical protein
VKGTSGSRIIDQAVIALRIFFFVTGRLGSGHLLSSVSGRSICGLIARHGDVTVIAFKRSVFFGWRVSHGGSYSLIGRRLSAPLLKQTWEKIALISSIHYANLRCYLTQLITLLGHKKAPNESGAFSHHVWHGHPDFSLTRQPTTKMPVNVGSRAQHSARRPYLSLSTTACLPGAFAGSFTFRPSVLSVKSSEP